MVVPGGKPSKFFTIMMFGEPGAEIMYPKINCRLALDISSINL